MDESKTYRLIPHMTPNEPLSIEGTREKGRKAIWKSSGTYVSLASLAREGVEGGGGITGVEEINKVPQQTGPQIPSSLNQRKKVAHLQSTVHSIVCRRVTFKQENAHS